MTDIYGYSGAIKINVTVDDDVIDVPCCSKWCFGDVLKLQVSLVIYSVRFFRLLVGSVMQERRDYMSQRSLALTAFLHVYKFIMLQFIC